MSVSLVSIFRWMKSMIQLTMLMINIKQTAARVSSEALVPFRRLQDHQSKIRVQVRRLIMEAERVASLTEGRGQH